jgi:hypothetical protein
MTFGLAQPKNITNLFGNWLKGIPKKDHIHIRVGVCALYGLCGTQEMILHLTNQKHIHS